MNAFFKKHADIVLNILAAVFMAIIFAYAFWAVSTFTQAAARAFMIPEGSQGVPQFDLPGAAALNLHGIAPTQP